MKFTTALFVSLIMIGFAASPARAKSGRCKLKSPNVLKLSGSTDAKMLACVQSKNLEGVKTVMVNSRGGKVSTALEIGDILAPLEAEFIITKQCSSSCANYFLPIARKITLQKNAMIIIHGSMDPGMARQMVKEHGRVGMWDIVERQQIYASKYNIHRGWLMYRDSYENGGGGQFDYVNGQPAWTDTPGKVTMILVEERMMRSCLPNVEITPFVDTKIDRANAKEKTKQRLVKQGIRASGSWECIGPSSAQLPTPDFAAFRAETDEKTEAP